jgi:hypothetical protein
MNETLKIYGVYLSALYLLDTAKLEEIIKNLTTEINRLNLIIDAIEDVSANLKYLQFMNEWNFETAKLIEKIINNKDSFQKAKAYLINAKEEIEKIIMK